MRWLYGILVVLAVACAAGPSALSAQPAESPEGHSGDALKQPLDGRDGRQLLLDRFRPTPMLEVPEHHLKQAKFPVIDAHTHFRYRFRHSPEMLDAFVELMDRHNIALCVSLDGKLGDELEEHKRYLWEKYADRFLIYANLDWQGEGDADDPASWACNRDDFARRMVEALTDAKKRGVSGLKIFKQFGLGYRNADGSLIKIDDRRFDPIWEACGKLGLPIIIHTADPAAFFLPIDEKNERWEELHRHPEWSFYGDEYPSREELLAARNRVIARHPKTTFIGAHVANNPEDLETVRAWLERYPNLVIGFASRIAELGRQPYSARKLFLDYPDRILYSTDGPWPELRITYYWRFLETFDENFPYSEKVPPPQGLWRIHGIGLPDEVLKKVYHENALRVIPGAREKYERYLSGKGEAAGGNGS